MICLHHPLLLTLFEVFPREDFSPEDNARIAAALRKIAPQVSPAPSSPSDRRAEALRLLAAMLTAAEASELYQLLLDRFGGLVLDCGGEL